MTLLLSVLPKLEAPYRWWHSNPTVLEDVMGEDSGFWLDKGSQGLVFFRKYDGKWQADVGGSALNTDIVAIGDTLDEVVTAIMVQLKLGILDGTT